METRNASRSFLFALCLTLFLLAVPAMPGHAQSSSGTSFGGVGLQVVPLVTGELVVLRVLDGSPAAGGGVKPGDLIIEVDGHSLAGSDFTEVVKSYLWGEPGTTVRLRLLRPGEQGEKTVSLRRVAMDPAAPAPPGVNMLRPDSVTK